MLVIPVMPVQLVRAAVHNVESQDFETGIYTTVSAMNGTNYTKQIQKDGATQWTFEKTGGTNFVGSYPTNMIATETNSVNTSHFATIAPAGLADGGGGANVKAWHNMTTKFSTTDGSCINPRGGVTLDIRLKKPTGTDYVSLVILDGAKTGYSTPSALKTVIMITMDKNGNLSYANECFDPNNKVTVPANNGSFTNSWGYVRAQLDFTTQTVELYYGDSLSSLKPFNTTRESYNFAANGSTKPYTKATGMACIDFEGKGSLSFDDLDINYDSGSKPPVASNVSVAGKPVIGETLTGSYTYSDADNDLEGGSTCYWRSAAESDFVSDIKILKTEKITAGQVSTYMPTEADLGRYIGLSVIPESAGAEDIVGYRASYNLLDSVRFPETKPRVSLTSPIEGDRVCYANAIQLASNATCDETTITKVEFYANDSKIGGSLAEPYTATWSNVALGGYRITARAYNALGEITDSTPVNIDVQPVTNITLYGQDGVNELEDSLDGITSITAKTQAANISQEVMNISLIIGLYDSDDKLIGIQCGDSFTLDSGVVNQPLEATININDIQRSNTKKINVFTWDKQKLMPYAPALEKVISGGISFNKVLDVYLLIGQSNMSGRAYIDKPDRPVLDRTYLLTGSDEWIPAVNPLNKYSTIEKLDATAGLNPGYTFSKRITQFVPDSELGVVVNARGGTAISEWKKGTYYYNEAIRRTRIALKHGRIKGILWHQGESDIDNLSNYMNDLSKLVSDLRADLGDNSLPFVAGQIMGGTAQKQAFNDMIATISDYIPNTACASSEGLTDIGDGVHFNTVSQRTLGERYADKMLKLAYGISVENNPLSTVNLSAQATTSAIAEYQSAGNAIDGDANTYWSAYARTSAVTQNSWYTLDLGQAYNITNIEMLGRTSGDYADERKEFEIQASNSDTFSTYAVIGRQESIPFEFQNAWSCFVTSGIKYRYVRVVKTVPGNLAISELRVFGN